MEEKYNPWIGLAEIVLKKVWDSELKEIIINNVIHQLTNNKLEKDELLAWLSIYIKRAGSAIENEKERKEEFVAYKKSLDLLYKNIDEINLLDEEIRKLISLAFIGLDEVNNEFYYIFYKSNIIAPGYISRIKLKTRMPFGFGSVGYSVRCGFEIEHESMSNVNEADICLGNMRKDHRARVNFTDYLLGNKSFMCIPLYDNADEVPKYLCSIALFLPITDIWSCHNNCLISSPQNRNINDKVCSLQIFKKIIYDQSTLLNIFSGNEYSVKNRFTDNLESLSQEYLDITKTEDIEASWLKEIVEKIVVQKGDNRPYWDIVGSPACLLCTQIDGNEFELSNLAISHTHFVKDIRKIVNMNMTCSIEKLPDYHRHARSIEAYKTKIITVKANNNSLGYEWSVELLYSFFDDIKEIIIPIHTQNAELLGILKIICSKDKIEQINELLQFFIKSLIWNNFVKLFEYFENIKRNSFYQDAVESVKDAYEISSVLYSLVPDYILQRFEDKERTIKEWIYIITPSIKRILNEFVDDSFNSVTSIKNTILSFLRETSKIISPYMQNILAISLWVSTESTANKPLHQIKEYIFPNTHKKLLNELFFYPNYSMLEAIVNQKIPKDTSNTTITVYNNIFQYPVYFALKSFVLYTKNSKVVTIHYEEIDDEIFADLEIAMNENMDIFNVPYSEILEGEKFIVIKWQKSYKDRMVSFSFKTDLLQSQIEKKIRPHKIKLSGELVENLFNPKLKEKKEIFIEIIRKDLEKTYNSKEEFLNKSITLLPQNIPPTDLNEFQFIKEISGFIKIDFLQLEPIRTNGTKKLLLLGHCASSRAGWINGISDDNVKFNKYKNDREFSIYIRLIRTLIENRLFHSFDVETNRHYKRRINMTNDLNERISKFRTIDIDTYDYIKQNCFYDGFLGPSEKVREAMAKIDEYSHNDETVIIIAPSSSGKTILFNKLAEKYLINKSIDVDNIADKKQICNLKNTSTIEELYLELYGKLSNGSIDEGKFYYANDGVIIFDEFGITNNERLANLESFFRKTKRKYAPVGSSIEDHTIDSKFILVTSFRVDQQAVRDNNKINIDSLGRELKNLVLLPSLEHRREDIPILINYFLYSEIVKNNLMDKLPTAIPLSNKDYKLKIIERQWSWAEGYHPINTIVDVLFNLLKNGKWDPNSVKSAFRDKNI